MKTVTLREEIASLPEDRRKEVEKLADALIAEEMTLRDLRRREIRLKPEWPRNSGSTRKTCRASNSVAIC